MRRYIALFGVCLFVIAAPWTTAAQPEELPLGSALPSVNASLQHVDGSSPTVSALMGETATVFIFWSNQCPWVDKYEGRVQDLAAAYAEEDAVRIVLVNANDASAFPSESLAASRARAEEADYAAEYVKDPTGTLASALGAARTPHAFVFDGAQTLVYAGSIDDSPGDPESVTTPYLRNAIEAVVSGTEVPVADTKAFGCMIKLPR
jgi:thiol-disulfide isomerase/thioredoxin